jgi:hypothetical protein
MCTVICSKAGDHLSTCIQEIIGNLIQSHQARERNQGHLNGIGEEHLATWLTVASVSPLPTQCSLPKALQRKVSESIKNIRMNKFRRVARYTGNTHTHKNQEQWRNDLKKSGKQLYTIGMDGKKSRSRFSQYFKRFSQEELPLTGGRTESDRKKNLLKVHSH